MNLHEGQLVFIRNGPTLETVTFVRYSSIDSRTAAIAPDDGHYAYKSLGPTVVIQRQNRLQTDVVMFEDIKPLPVKI